MNEGRLAGVEYGWDIFIPFSDLFIFSNSINKIQLRIKRVFK